MKLIVWTMSVVIALASATRAPAVQAQSFSAFVAPVYDEGFPATPEDKRVSANATGPMQTFRGRAWWQALAFCIGTHLMQTIALEMDGDEAGAEALRSYYVEQFEEPAIRRLMSDRGVSEAEAIEILEPDVEFQRLQVFTASEEARPFVHDQARCRAVAGNHARLQ